jgi:hypothetical protein
MQRARMSLPYYRANGWEPVVLTVDESWQLGTLEPGLLATVPPDVRVVRTRAVPPRWARRIGVGNLGLRSWLFLLWSGARLLRREKFDLVFFSNTQFVTFTLGRLWRWRFGVPYVLDVQDPWRTDYYEQPGSSRPPGGWKYQLARLAAWTFEGWSFAGAAGVMSVSPAYLDQLSGRYPSFSAKPRAVIRFGASAADIARARNLAPSGSGRGKAGSEIHFLYTGASGPVMPHAISILFHALRSYRERHPAAAARFKFHFVGTSYAAPGEGKYSVIPLAGEFGVGDQVDEIPHRVGFFEAIRLQLDADILLLPGSSDPAYSPSKVYLYYLADRPILGLVFRNSVMERLLDEMSCAYMVRFGEGDRKEGSHAEIHRFFDLALSGFPTGSLPVRNQADFHSRYMADGLTRRQCDLFDAAVGFAASPR